MSQDPRVIGEKNIYVNCLKSYPHNEREKLIGTWLPLTVTHYCVKFDARKSCRSGNITSLFWQVTSRDQKIKGTC